MINKLNYHLIIVLLINLINYLLTEEIISKVSDDWSFDQLIPKNYNRVKPNIINGKPVKVNITLILNKLIAASEGEQSITVDLFFYQHWIDQRIKLPNESDSITLDSSWKNKLWIPNLNFINSVENKPVDLVSNTLFIEINNGSYFTMGTRVIVKLNCHMKLFNFPQDTQICNVDLACVNWSNQSVNFFLNQFTMSHVNDFPKFEITDYFIEKCSFYRGDEYPCLRVRIELFRRISYYILRIYGPSTLLTLTSFVGFWIPVVGYPARVAIVVTPLLALITQQAQINAEINVPHIVALHIWMMIQIFFVFMSLLEYVVAIAYCHLVEEKKEYRQSSTYRLQFTPESSKLSHTIKIVLDKIYGQIDWIKNPLDRNKIDYVSRITFPMAYLINLIVYISIFGFPWVCRKYL